MASDNLTAASKSFQPGDRVVYIPGHATGDIGHPDIELGTVSSVRDLTRDGEYRSTFVFVKFDEQVQLLGWDGTTSQSCDIGTLVKLDGQAVPK